MDKNENATKTEYECCLNLDYCLAKGNCDDLCKKYGKGNCEGCPMFDSEQMDIDEYEDQCNDRDD